MFASVSKYKLNTEKQHLVTTISIVVIVNVIYVGEINKKGVSCRILFHLNPTWIPFLFVATRVIVSNLIQLVMWSVLTFFQFLEPAKVWELLSL